MSTRLKPLLLAMILAAPMAAQAAPATRGYSGLFEMASGDTLPKGKFNVGLYADQFDRRVLSVNGRPNVPNPPLFNNRRTFGLEDYYYSLGLGYGIVNWLEFSAYVPYKVSSAKESFRGFDRLVLPYADFAVDKYNESGMGDPRVQLKARFVNSKVGSARLTAAIMAEAKIPVADKDKGLGTEAFDFGGRLAFSANWRVIGLHLNGGYYFIGDPKRSVKAAGFGGDDKVALDNQIYGAAGFDICIPRNLKIIGEFEYSNNIFKGDKANDLDRYYNEVANGVLGLRYFFTPKKYSREDQMSKYQVALSAAARWGFAETRKHPDQKKGDTPIGFVAGISISPRLESDICTPGVRKGKGKQPPTVSAVADPPSFTIPNQFVDNATKKFTGLTKNDDGTFVLPKNKEGKVVAIESVITATAHDADNKPEELTYSWRLAIGDVNATTLKDKAGKPITSPSFIYNFVEAKTHRFIVKVTDPDNQSATAETSVTFSVVGPSDGGVYLPTVYFEFDKQDIRPLHKQQLQEVADLLAKYGTVNIKLEGYTCPIGTINYNLALGQRRAQAVYNYLKALGVQTVRMETISYGEEKQFLIVGCATEDCMSSKRELSPNRRTEIKVTGGWPSDVKLDERNKPGNKAGAASDPGVAFTDDAKPGKSDKGSKSDKKK